MLFQVAALTLGFLGSFHCVAMCGPIALALPLDRKNRVAELSGILTYNAGRVLVYFLMGCLFGMVGTSFVIGGYQRSLSVTVGLLLLVSVILPGKVKARFRFNTGLFSFISSGKACIGKLFRRTGYVSLLLIGALNGLLPCGFVYTALAGAVVAGGVLKGGLFMLFFGLGTLPAMAVLSLAGNKLSSGHRKKIRQVMPVFVIGMALLLVLRGLNLGIPYLSPELSSAQWSQHICCHAK